LKRVDSGIDKNIARPKVNPIGKRNGGLNKIDEQGESQVEIEGMKLPSTSRPG